MRELRDEDVNGYWIIPGPRAQFNQSYDLAFDQRKVQGLFKSGGFELFFFWPWLGHVTLFWDIRGYKTRTWLLLRLSHSRSSSIYILFVLGALEGLTGRYNDK
jgi:hypothetical protein